MKRRMVISLALLALAAVLVLPGRMSAQGRPDCAAVLRQLHDIRGHKGPREPDPVKIAARIGTDAEWVEHCAQSYGRRVKRTKPSGRDPEVEMTLKESREAEEYDEISREEKETLGDRYVTVIEDDETDRKKLKAVREEDTVNEWEPYETHEWEPNLGHPWEGPVLRDDEDD